MALGVNFTNILWAAFTSADPKSAKKTIKSSSFLALLGSARINTLMKSTNGLNNIFWQECVLRRSMFSHCFCPFYVFVMWLIFNFIFFIILVFFSYCDILAPSYKSQTFHSYYFTKKLENIFATFLPVPYIYAGVCPFIL